MSMHEANLPECMTPAEVAKLLRCSRKTVTRLIRSKRLRAHKLSSGRNGRLRILRRDFLAFLEENEV